MTTDLRQSLRRIDDNTWELLRDYKQGMRVPGMLFASESMLDSIFKDRAAEQMANVAFLPGIVGHSLAMPDIHWGYGFPIGGVAATRVHGGVVSPGGVGFDINCGVRLLRTDLTVGEVQPLIERLMSTLYSRVPSGVGSKGSLQLNAKEIDRVMVEGAAWSVKHGYGMDDDLEVTEENGRVQGADPRAVGKRPRERGAGQLGTLGSGNHFLEVQVIDEVFEPTVARAFGLGEPGQVVMMIHCGSRGFGHQVCEDHVKNVAASMQKHGISVPDRQLACAPVGSPEGRGYLEAMWCAANFAWANRQVITHWVREAFESVFRKVVGAARHAPGL